MLAKNAKTIFLAYSDAQQFLPKGSKTTVVGNPVVVPAEQKTKSQAIKYFGLKDNLKTIFVFGGSQGARILSDVVPGAIALLPDSIRANLRVSHQARAEDGKRVRAYYAEQGITAEVQPFFQDVPRRMAEAQLVISRAGASSIADLAVIGRPSILIPYAAAAGDHQSANARGLVEADAAILIPESKLSAPNLSEHIKSILSNADAALRMSQAALSVGAPDATERLVALVRQLAVKETT